VFVDTLKRACGTYYGTAGPDFIRGLFRDGIESVQEELRLAVEQTTKALMPPGASTEVTRAVKRFALVAVSGELAIAKGIVPWAKGDVFRAVKMMMIRWLHGRGGYGGDTERALTAVRDFILRDESSRFRDIHHEGEKVINLAGYRDRAQGVIHFTSQGFREACADHHHQMVARALAEKGFLRTREKDRLQNRITIPGVGERIRVYTVTAALLEEEDLDEKDLVQGAPRPATKDP
jgi:putative DNA primase/helicase